jgi:RNA polymerase sigma-B factor
MITTTEHRTGCVTLTSAQLFERWHRGDDRRCRDELIERFLPLARKLASRYIRSGEPFDDLVQVASIGLVNAVDRFDPERGFAFTSFAVPTIVGELKRHFRDHGWTLHVARGARERSHAIADADATIRAETGRAPSVHELALYLELTTEEVMEGLQTVAAREPMSLDAPIALDEMSAPVTRADTIGELDERLRLVDERLAVLDATGRLPKREREVLYLRYGADLTQTEIADRVGVSQMQVSRLLRRSLVRLREQLDGERLAS